MAREPSPVTLVFDSLHSLVHPALKRGMAALIRYRPPTLRLVLITADAAAVDVSNDALDGSVVEIGPDLLAFDVDQTFRALASTGQEWSADEASEIHRATEGWPAGVYLTASRREPGGPAPSFAAGEDPVRSFLRHRVLRSLDPAAREFFLQMAALGEVNGPMCEDLTGRADAGWMLDRLAELHLATDLPGSSPGWRRFPGYVTVFALRELRGADAVETRDLCRRAATWCAERGLFEQAMRTASRAEDTVLMADILLANHQRWSASGDAAAVRQWCGVLSQAEPTLVEAHLASAWASVFLGEDSTAASSAALVEALDLPDDRGAFVRGELAMLRANLSRRSGYLLRSLDQVRAGEAVAHALPPTFTSRYRGALGGTLGLHIGVAALWAGECDEAVVQLERAQRHLRAVAHALPALHGHLALAHWLLDHESARVHAEMAVAHLRSPHRGPGGFTAMCIGVITGVRTGADRLEEIQASVDELREPVVEAMALAAEVFQCADNDRHRALEALRRLRALVDSCPEPGVLVAVAERTAGFLSRAGDAALGEPLTDGEQRVLRMLGGSLTEREIAAELHLSHNTVRTYRRRLYKKLGVTSRSEAARVGRVRAV